jgi:hypothetical protein
MKVTTLGIDLAKNVFQLHGVNGMCPRQISGRVYTVHKRETYQLLNLQHWL